MTACRHTCTYMRKEGYSGEGRVGCGRMEATAYWCSACVSMHQTANCLLLEVCNCGSCAVHMHAQHHVMLITHHQCPMQLVAHDQEMMLEGLVGVKEMKQLTVYIHYYKLHYTVLKSLVTVYWRFTKLKIYINICISMHAGVVYAIHMCIEASLNI